MASNNNIAGISKYSPDKIVQINRGFIKVIKAILHAAVANLALVNATVIFRCVNIQQYRHLIVGDAATNVNSDVRLTEDEFIISTQLSLATHSTQDDSLCIPINFGSTRIGYLIASSELSLAADEIQIYLNSIIREMISVIKRYQMRDKMFNAHGDQAYWIGCSPALRQLDQLNDKLATTQTPIVIKGNKGTGKSLAARTLHCYSCDTLAPFIESSCDKWEANGVNTLLNELWSAANGGTLYLRNVDKLSPKDFNLLKDSWQNLSSIDTNSNQKNNTRLIMSLSSSFAASDHRAIFAWLENMEALCVPELKERREDIRDLTRFFIRDYQLNIEFDFDESAWELLTDYDWPGNVPQLKAIIQKLATMIEKPWITKADLVRFCPELESSNSKLSDTIAYIKPVAALKQIKAEKSIERTQPSFMANLTGNRNFYFKGVR